MRFDAAAMILDQRRKSDRPSPRQMEILELIAQDYTTREIAENLEIAYETTRTHVEKLLWRCRVHSRAGAVAVGFRRGWLT
jgi:DNA-binding NarL/FixJ family response regulator